MDGYGIIGMVLLVTAIVWIAYTLRHAKWLKSDVYDQQVIRAAIIVRVRNAAIFFAICFLAFFFFILSGLPKFTAGTAAYITQDRLSTIFLVTSIVLLAISIVLAIISHKSKYNFARLARRYVKRRKKVRTKFKLKRRPKWMTRV